MIPKPKHFDALLGKELVALFISRPLIGESVATAVEFQRQLGLGAEEIEEVAAARILAAKLEFSETAATKQAPEALLSVG